MKKALIVISFFVLLNGCSFSYVLSGVNLVHDRYYVTSVLKDQQISLIANQTLNDSPEFVDNGSISVATCNKVVLLTGHTKSWHLWKRARKKVARIPGVRRIYNFIKVRNKTKPTDYIKDTWITTKIRTKIITNFDVDPRKVKVVTDSGTVYLMGRMQRKEANQIVKMVKDTDGVKRVKRLFEYIIIVQS